MFGYAVDIISEHEVAFDITISLPAAFKIFLMAIVAGHPAHDV